MEQDKSLNQSTIAAIATPPGTGGIAVIRISGPQAFEIVDSAWKGRTLSSQLSHTAHLGTYVGMDGEPLDQALATIFRAPNSFTGEDVVELSLHGSKWIQANILTDLIARGATMAQPGEFTRRAFLNRRIDLAQAEGIADLISASSRKAHRLAMQQTKGSFSRRLEQLRERLIEFASLLELELDFSEEDVEFADRSKLLSLAHEIHAEARRLAISYAKGSAIKEGVNIVIAGVPNAGKSSLLNLLLEDDKAIVSNLPGTTRDVIEDTTEIDGVLFRFIDTAGLRTSDDTIENLGIKRALSKMTTAHAIIWLFDTASSLEPQLDQLQQTKKGLPDDIPFIFLANKSDLSSTITEGLPSDALPFSAATGLGLTTLKQKLTALVETDDNCEADIMVTNGRHYEALLRGSQSLERAIEGINNSLSADFIAQDVREALHHLGSITGSITTSTLLHSIFSRFCIGK